jgi:hypothetical protein
VPKKKKKYGRREEGEREKKKEKWNISLNSARNLLSHCK